MFSPASAGFVCPPASVEYGGYRTGRGAGSDAPQGGIRRDPRRGRTGGHIRCRGGRLWAGRPADSGRKGGFLGTGAGPMEGVDSPETHAVQQPKAAAPHAFSPPAPPHRGFVHFPLQRRDVGEGAEHVGAVQAVAHHPDVGNLKAQARSHGPFGATN